MSEKSGFSGFRNSADQFHLSVVVIVLFLSSCFFGSILPISITIGTLARRPARMQVPVGSNGTYSKDTLSRYEIVCLTAWMCVIAGPVDLEWRIYEFALGSDFPDFFDHAADLMVFTR